MRSWIGILGSFAILALVSTALFASEMYLSYWQDGSGDSGWVQEGDALWICVRDDDANVDPAVRETIWADVRLLDMNTGASLEWISHDSRGAGGTGSPYGSADYQPFIGHSGKTPGDPSADCLIETTPDSGLFVSRRAVRIGTREDPEDLEAPAGNTHTLVARGDAGVFAPLRHGGFVYEDGVRGWVDASLAFVHAVDALPGLTGSVLPSDAAAAPRPGVPLAGRVENMDTLVGMYTSPMDPGDVAVTQVKIVDTRATISWSQPIYRTGGAPAVLTVVDPDENLHPGRIELVPVFVLVNPGSWNPVEAGSANDFASLLASGGVDGANGAPSPAAGRIAWYTIYDSAANATGVRGAADGRYYVRYPTRADGNVTWFATQDARGVTAVSFHAQETGTDTGVFELRLAPIAGALGFEALGVRDVLVAYYLDPNDFDDFTLATATIEAEQRSRTTITDFAGASLESPWLGRDPLYFEVADSNVNRDPCVSEQLVVQVAGPQSMEREWVILDEMSSNAPAFFTFAGFQLLPPWEEGPSDGASVERYRVHPDNWRVELANEEAFYVRYNDVDYDGWGPDGLSNLGDGDIATAFPPRIDAVRLANDISFDLGVVADTQTFDGVECHVGFLDGDGNDIDSMITDSCIRVRVVDPDQNEDDYRRETIDAFWDGGQGLPFGLRGGFVSGVAQLLALGSEPIALAAGAPKLFVVNLRNGRWAAIDLEETGDDTGEFVSVECVLLQPDGSGEPSLDAQEGDTLLAVYQDPSNLSDVAIAHARFLPDRPFDPGF